MDKKNVVALSDDALDMVSGGLVITPTRVKNEDTGDIYNLKVPSMDVFIYVSELGDISDSERIAKLLEKGYIG